MRKLYYIDYPQEHLEGQMHSYCCVHCKVPTTTINGKLEGHLPSCEYRIRLEREGYDCKGLSEHPASSVSDEFD